MGFLTRYFWPIIGVLTLVGVVSLALNIGLPAAIAGVIGGGLLMWREVQNPPPPVAGH